LINSEQFTQPDFITPQHFVNHPEHACDFSELKEIDIINGYMTGWG